MQIFTVQGLVIGLVGVTLGTIGGILLSNNLAVLVRFIESLTGNELLPADVYYISGGVPSVVNPNDVFIIVTVAIIMCLLATIYPAWRAARTNPVEALRYE
jgi:lipoprotein-releasing system permease protein